MRHNDKFIASLCPSFDLELGVINFQFLWLVPLIEVMWADGRCQKEEIEVLFQAVERFVNTVKPEAPEITLERAQRFLAPLVDASIGYDPRKLTELTRLSDFIIDELVSSSHHDKRLDLFNICVEIAAAAQAVESERKGRRISQGEEQVLRTLLQDLNLD